MLVNGTSASGKRIEIGEDFSILIKKPSVYVNEFTDETLLMIFRPKERLDNYKEGKFSIDDETPINGNFNLLRSGTFTHNVDVKDYDPSTVLDDIDINDIDIEKLRNDLIEYFTSAMFIVSPVALVDLTEVENASDEKVIKIALDNKFDLSKYIK